MSWILLFIVVIIFLPIIRLIMALMLMFIILMMGLNINGILTIIEAIWRSETAKEILALTVFAIGGITAFYFVYAMGWN